MNRSLKCLLMLSVILSGYACNKDENEPSGNGGNDGTEEENVETKTLDFIEIGKAVNTDCAVFYEENKQYVFESDANHTDYQIKAIDQDRDSLNMRVIADKNGAIEKIILTARDQSKNTDLWKKYVGNAADYTLGRFLGTKFSRIMADGSTQGGIKQTEQESIDYVNTEGTEKTLVYTIFGINSKTYAAPCLIQGDFRFEFLKNYLPLDFSQLGTLVGSDIDETLKQYNLIANKIQFGNALSYLYFDSAIDNKGNAFTVNMDSDASLKKIKEISAYAPERLSDDEIIALWKQYLAGYSELGLGTLKEIFVNDAFGDKLKTLESVEEAYAMVEEFGRQYSILAQFSNGEHENTLVLNKDYLFIVIR